MYFFITVSEEIVIQEETIKDTNVGISSETAVSAVTPGVSVALWQCMSCQVRFQKLENFEKHAKMCGRGREENEEKQPETPSEQYRYAPWMRSR